MLVLKLCEQLCPDKIPCVANKKLGDGADGEVFDIIDEPNKVIKFCVLYQNSPTHPSVTYKQITEVLDCLIATPLPTYASVYSHGYMGEFSRTVWGDQQQTYLIYYYLMEKLHKLTEDESRVLHSLMSHEDREIKKNFSALKIQEMIRGMSRALDFDSERVTFFVDNFKNNQMAHLDIHVRNIMKDWNGNFKLVDFDRATIKRK